MNDDDHKCQCDGTSTPANCMWERCNPYPTNATKPNAPPPCCCASLDIKMQWVVDVQHALRTFDPTLTLGGVNIDIENVGDCHKALMLTYMREFMYNAGEYSITVGDTVGYLTGSYIEQYFGVANVANTTGVAGGAVPTPPLAVLYIQVSASP